MWQSADAVIYFASFHHIPVNKMNNALAECGRILKLNGKAVFVEPLSKYGSYYELVRIVKDEAEIQKEAYIKIREAGKTKFRETCEDYFYIERTINDYKKLLDTYVDDPVQRKDFIKKAELRIDMLANRSGIKSEDFRFKSIIRLNALQKITN